MKTPLLILGLQIGIILLLSFDYCYWKTSSELDSIRSELDSIKKLIKIQNNLPTTTTAKTATKTPSTTTTSTTTTTTFKKEEFKPKCDEYEYNFMIWVKCGKIRTEEEMNTFIDKIRSTRKYEDLTWFEVLLFWIGVFILIAPLFIVEICEKKQKHRNLKKIVVDQR